MGTVWNFIVLPFGSVLLGGLITWLVSKHFCIRAAKELNYSAVISATFSNNGRREMTLLWFKSSVGPSTGQSIPVPVGVLEGKLSTFNPAKPSRAE